MTTKLRDFAKADNPSLGEVLGPKAARMDFALAVQCGLIDGWSTLDKYGFNPMVESVNIPEDIWEGGGDYNWSTTADIVSLASSNAADTMDILVQGLDEDWNEVLQTITLQGTTRIALTTPLLRCYRMLTLGEVDVQGTVFCYTGTGTVPAIGDSNVRAIIQDGNNQTQMCIYTVPNGKVGFLVRGEAGILYEGGGPLTGLDYLEGAYYSRRQGEVWRIKKTIGTIVSGDSNYEDKRSFPDKIPARTDIRLNAKVVSEDMGVWGTFDMYLVDEDQFTDEYLAELGQPGY